MSSHCATPWRTTQSRRTDGFRSGCHPGALRFSIDWPKRSLGDPDTDEFLSVFDANQYDPDASLTIGELDFHFHPTVHYVPCWAVRISNGVDGDLFYTADTGPAANLAAVATGSHLIVAEGTDRGISHEPYESRGHMTPAEAGALGPRRRRRIFWCYPTFGSKTIRSGRSRKRRRSLAVRSNSPHPDYALAGKPIED